MQAPLLHHLQPLGLCFAKQFQLPLLMMMHLFGKLGIHRRFASCHVIDVLHHTSNKGQ